MTSEHDHVAICEHPVFIIGSPRSGTTAMAHALKQHPELFVSKESYVLHQFYGNGRLRQVWEHNNVRVTPNWIRHEEISYEELLGHLGVGMNSLFSSRSGGLRWVDQTPLYTPMVADLAIMFPGARFLHLVRDGRAVVRSMSGFADVFTADARDRMLDDEIPGWADDAAQACDTWAEWVRIGAAFADEHPQRCLQIRNEDLVADPDGGFDLVQRFLELDAHDGPANAWRTRRINSSFRDMSSRPADRWDDWPTMLRSLFVDRAGPTLVDQGYATERELDEWVTDER